MRAPAQKVLRSAIVRDGNVSGLFEIVHQYLNRFRNPTVIIKWRFNYDIRLAQNEFQSSLATLFL
jgi:hypothetical protein